MKRLTTLLPFQNVTRPKAVAKLAKPSATKISQGQDPDSPAGIIPFGKRVRGVTVTDKVFVSFIDKVCQQGLSPT